MKLLFSIIPFLLLLSCDVDQEEYVAYQVYDGAEIHMFIKKDVHLNIFGLYQIPKEKYSFSWLYLFPDSTYEYSYSGCTSASMDSGNFTFQDSIITFQSTALAHTKYPISKSKAPPPPPSPRHKVESLGSAKFKNGVLVLDYDKGYPMIYYKKGFNHFRMDLLDSNGNGDSFVIDSFSMVIEEGFYEDFKLLAGYKYKYSKSQEVFPIETIKIGKGKVVEKFLY